MLGNSFAPALGSVLVAASALAAQSPPVDSVRMLVWADLTDDALAYGRSAVATSPDDAGSHCALALAAKADGSLDLSVESGERCVRLAPRVSAYQLILGESYLEKATVKGGFGALGLAMKGKASVERAVRLDLDNVGARITLVEYHMEAPIIAGGSKREARRQAEEISRRDPARGVWARLRVMGDKVKDEAFKRVFEEGLPLAGTPDDSTGLAMISVMSVATRVKSDALHENMVAKLYATRPEDPRARYARARLWRLQGRNLEQAEEIFLDYLQLPGFPSGSPSKGGTYWRLGALGAYENLIAEFPPGHPAKAAAYWQIGQVYERQGRTDDALVAYRTAVELAPQFEEAADDIKRLEKN